ncbi:MAG: hypothetical protein WC498_02345 [Candidatus Saccharimonadales bacterium]
MTHVINREVAINSFYFTGGKGLKTFPRQMELDGSFITFVENGLRYLVQKGGQAVRLFDMSSTDGTTYRLRQEGNQWTLVGTL